VKPAAPSPLSPAPSPMLGRGAAVLGVPLQRRAGGSAAGKPVPPAVSLSVPCSVSTWLVWPSLPAELQLRERRALPPCHRDLQLRAGLDRPALSERYCTRCALAPRTPTWAELRCGLLRCHLRAVPLPGKTISLRDALGFSALSRRCRVPVCSGNEFASNTC